MIRIMVAGLVGGLLCLLYANLTIGFDIPFVLNLFVGFSICFLVYSVLNYFDLL